jgi:hypothetical protein
MKMLMLLLMSWTKLLDHLLPDKLVDADTVFPAAAGGVANDDDVPELAIHRGLLSVSYLINTLVAESTHCQYSHDNADFMIYF